MRRDCCRDFISRGCSVRAAVSAGRCRQPNTWTPAADRSRDSGAGASESGHGRTTCGSPAVVHASWHPDVILLWNVLPSYKVLIADLAIESRVFDVSPGEMNFESLARVLPAAVVRSAVFNCSGLWSSNDGSIVKYSSERRRAEQVLGTAVHVIPNGVPIPVEQVRHGERSVVVFGTSARINPQKRLEELLNRNFVAGDSYEQL